MQIFKNHCRMFNFLKWYGTLHMFAKDYPSAEKSQMAIIDLQIQSISICSSLMIQLHATCSGMLLRVGCKECSAFTAQMNGNNLFSA